MLELWLCPSRKQNTARVMQALCEKTAQRILVVPEQFSHEAERMLCRAGGDTISRFAEVLSFSRLASRVFSIEGGSACEETDAGGRLLLMALAVEQVRPRLKLFGASTSRPEFLLQLLDTLLPAAGAAARGIGEAQRRAGREDRGICPPDGEL